MVVGLAGGMLYVVLAILWVAIGAGVGLVEARRGHWHKGWVVSSLFGPFAVPLALQRRGFAEPEPVVLLRGKARRGPVDVLVGLDGSASSTAAAEVALGLLGPRVRRVTLATVLDVDTAAPHADSLLYPEPYPEEVAARELLDRAAGRVRASSGHAPGSVILAGEPAAALGRYAVEEGYELIVVGCRPRGLSKLVLGSCASKLAGEAPVPVLLIPAEPARSGRSDTTDPAASTASA